MIEVNSLAEHSTVTDASGNVFMLRSINLPSVQDG